MKSTKKLYLVALALALTATMADARKPVRGGSSGGGGTSTNFGCKTMPAGTVLGTNVLSADTWVCYLCNLTTRVCTVNSPSTLYGATFILP